MTSGEEGKSSPLLPDVRFNWLNVRLALFVTYSKSVVYLIRHDSECALGYKVASV